MINVIVIGGTNSTIGVSLCNQLKNDGHNVISTHYSKDVMESKIQSFFLDVTKEESVKEFVEKVYAKYKEIHCLINNAGVFKGELLTSSRLSNWEHIIDVNLMGVYNTCKFFSKKMISVNKGKIINISSTKGFNGDIGGSAYAVSKAGVTSLSKALAKELAKFNISVNVVCPGYIKSNINSFGKLGLEDNQNCSYFDISNNLSNVCNFISFLTSDKMVGVTGQVFNIDSRIF